MLSGPAGPTAAIIIIRLYLIIFKNNSKASITFNSNVSIAFIITVALHLCVCLCALMWKLEASSGHTLRP